MQCYDMQAMQRVLLISPVNPRDTAYLERTKTSANLAGWRLRYYLHEMTDLDVHVDVLNADVYEEIPDGPYDFVGVTSYYPTKTHDISWGVAAKKRYDARLIIGGPNYWESDWYLERGADHVIEGEGEYPLEDLLRGANDTVFEQEPLSVPDYREATLNCEWEKMPWEACWTYNRETFDESPVIRLVTMSYCDRGCTFCASRNMFDGPMKYLTTTQLRELMERTGKLLPEDGKLIMQGDDEMLGPCKRRWTELADDGWTSPRPFIIQTNQHAIDENTVEVLKQVGCYMVTMGIESFNDEKLDKWNKSYGTATADGNETAIRLLVENGIHVFGNLIVENDERTLEMVDRLQAEYPGMVEWGKNPSVIQLPGSEMWFQSEGIPHKYP